MVADLHDTSLRDALYSDEMKRIRSRHIRKELEGTVCNKCVYGIDGYMNPITDKMGFEGCYPPVYDRVDEIKKRFSDKT